MLNFPPFGSTPAPTATPPIFQTYLIPALPFRRRRSSASIPTSPLQSPAAIHDIFDAPFSPSASTASSATPLSPASTFPTSPQLQYLSSHTSHISCAHCHADLALTSQIVSKGFNGRHGRAFLVAPPTASPPPRRPSIQATASLLSTRTPSAFSLPGSFPGLSAANSSDGGSSGSSGRRTRSNSGSRHGATGQRASSTSAVTTTTSSLPPTTPAAPAVLPNTFLHKAMSRQLVTGLHTVADVSCAPCGAVLGWRYIAAEDPAQRYKVGKYILESKRVVVGSFWEAEDEVADGPGERGADTSGGQRRGSLFGCGEGWGLNEWEEEELLEAVEEDEDELEDLFAGVWSPELARRRRARRMSGR